MANSVTMTGRPSAIDDGFARQLDSLQGRIVGLVRQAGGALDEETVQDLAQEVIVRCWERRLGIERLEAYVRVVARNVVTDHLRSPEQKIASLERIAEDLGVDAEAVVSAGRWTTHHEGSGALVEETVLREAEARVVQLCVDLAIRRSPKDAVLIWGYLHGHKLADMLPHAEAHTRTAAQRRVTRALEWAARYLRERQT